MLRRLLLGCVLLFPLRVHAQWRPFFDGALFVTHASEVGPKNSESRVFSTNWLSVGAERQLGRLTLLAGGRITLEPLTVPKDGYPQLLQYAPPLVDRMRAHDLVEEIAVGAEWRALRVYLAPVGEPPLGAEPYAQRNSSIDFAEAPFAYDVQESFHVATRVISAGVTSSAVAVDGGVFHASHTTGRHTSIDDGNIDSWSARLTIAPHAQLSAQISTGHLGDENREVTSASVSYRGTSAIWTKNGDLRAYGVETALRPGRSTILARAEWVDRPAAIFSPDRRRMAHITLGYIIDVIHSERNRAGAGINIDYHSSTKSLTRNYGHKPQGIYAFVRLRTTRIR